MPTSIIVYADGACRGNPGAGAWAAVIYDAQVQRVWEIAGHEPHTTNNRMELKAVMGALAALATTPGDLTFYVDSTYVIQGITQWVKGWQNRNWQTASGTPVANRDLWEPLLSLVRLREKHSAIRWQHVFGHAGVPGNERADTIAQAFADKQSLQLFDGKFADYPIDLVNLPSSQSQKRSNKSRSSKKAYLYLSLVNGALVRHSSWAECSARVKGVPKAKFKKVLSPEEEQQVLQDWGLA